ncbi:hypothetical protein K443DRAFT_11284 [Laccaria amethystina LaAM-08-1]|uniref:Uncharacterized protein n=1 Tax=Laccaria amethystina LaAM-08-1 TaxID=1095629 RepID=A0A0C9WU02_9AGAR|nr:hypothetical protein K443DRAFT_11284 [Laccaria amethystina LaAM-08-1]
MASSPPATNGLLPPATDTLLPPAMNTLLPPVMNALSCGMHSPEMNTLSCNEHPPPSHPQWTALSLDKRSPCLMNGLLASTNEWSLPLYLRLAALRPPPSASPYLDKWSLLSFDK